MFGFNTQICKYNGKEFDTMHGLNMYDYGARQQDPAVGMFTSMDPLCEKYYNISPYSYCAGNPIRYVDPTGMAIYYGQNGKFLGDDGEDDDRIFLANDKKNKDIDKSNLQNYQDRFTDITLFVNNFETIQHDVEKDNGKGGTKDCNNREYGGYFDAEGKAYGGYKGKVSVPSNNLGAELEYGSLQSNILGTYHTHPSGDKEELNIDNTSTTSPGGWNPTTTTHCYEQPPSKYDIQNAISNSINCVFARGSGNKNCYFYTKDRNLTNITYANFKDIVNNARPRK